MKKKNKIEYNRIPLAHTRRENLLNIEHHMRKKAAQASAAKEVNKKKCSTTKFKELF